MDLSTGGDIDGMRRLTLSRAGIPVGGVPVYQAAIQETLQPSVKNKAVVTMAGDHGVVSEGMGILKTLCSPRE